MIAEDFDYTPSHLACYSEMLAVHFSNLRTGADLRLRVTGDRRISLQASRFDDGSVGGD